jgi:hypothetical protein
VHRLSPGFLSAASLAGSAIVVGVAVGYFAGTTGGMPLSAGVLAIMGLMLAGLLTAFYGGRVAASREQPQASSLHRSWDAFRRELDRARRFEHPFALLRFPSSEAMEGGKHGLGGLATLPLVLRSIDQVWAMDGSVYVVMPEATGDAARQLVERLRSAMPGEPALDEVEMVEFPKDGVTTGALVSNLRAVSLDPSAAPVRLVHAPVSDDDSRTERTG